MIKIENLRLNFPGRLDLSIDKLSIERGSIFTVMGPNGAGKSTLLNIIALFQKPDAGRIEVGGENIFDIKDSVAFRRKISFVFSQPYLFNDSVYHNVAMPLKLRFSRDTKAVDDALGLFKITHLREKPAPTLSQGERYRVALARAFVTKPDLVLLDEPFLSLDARFKESLINELRKIIKINDITAIFVTQDQSEALGLADTMAIMINGRILQHSRTEEIFTKPASREVALFAGIETIAEGEISRKDDNLCSVRVKGNVLEVVSEYGQGDDVFVCIRPEDIVISKHEETTSARNHLRARIVNIEPWRLGYKLRLDCGFDLIASVTKQSIKNLKLKLGDEVFASFKATAVHLIKR